MELWEKVKRTVLGRKNMSEQTIQEKQRAEEEGVYELEESTDVEADLEREAAYLKEELAAAKLELITGKEERINWRRFFEIILRK